MPYIIVDAATYNTSHAEYQIYPHEDLNGTRMVEPLTKVKALEERSGAALTAAEIAAGEPDRPTQTFTVRWCDLK